jgi:hypothetical protein
MLLDTGSFLEESGLLKRVSTYFSEYEIPIMYITTFNNNYIFIPIEYDDKVSIILKDKLVQY